jgi:hypothetical protein
MSQFLITDHKTKREQKESNGFEVPRMAQSGTSSYPQLSPLHEPVAGE